MAGASESTLVVGRIAGAFGVRGWVKLQSFTDPAENLVHYADWRVAVTTVAASSPQARRIELLEWRWHGERLVGRLAGVDDRDAAAALNGAEIVVPRSALPPAGDESWYWADLMGFEVVNVQEVRLGTLSDVIDNGAQDVMVVSGQRERLIPFVRDRFVRRVDVAARRIEVDWDEDY